MRFETPVFSRLAALSGPAHAIASDLLDKAVLAAGPIIALDVFDTLVERSVRPEHVKILACERIVQHLGLDGTCGLDLYERRRLIEINLGRRALAQDGEAEYRHAEMAENLFEELQKSGCLPRGLQAVDFIAAALCSELNVERQVLRVKAGVLNALHAAREAGKRVLLLSDFYLPALTLTSLLASVGIEPALYDSIYVSSDRMASKRSGRLFKLVLEETGFSASDITMFGDNPHSDVAMAIKSGFHAVLVQDEARLAYYGSDAADVTQPLRLRRGLLALVDASNAPAVHLRHAVPALLLFTERLYCAARRQRLRHLFFLAREGQFLERIFNAYQDALGYQLSERISTHYVLASRRACYSASLEPIELESFVGLFAHYRCMSLRDFCRSLGFSSADTLAVAACLDCNADEVERDFPNSKIFSALRNDPNFISIYDAHRVRQRDNLRSYLCGFGVDLLQHPLAVVDCGWKGSIQDFLRCSLPRTIAIQGFYIGLLDVGQEVASKVGLLFSNVGGLSKDYLVFAENRSLFEVLLCADHGSAVSYECETDGSIRVVLDEDPVERGFTEFTLSIVRDAEEAFRDLAALRTAMVTRPETWERMVAETHANLVFRPWLSLSRWLMKVQHRESFGVFHLSQMTLGGKLSISDRLLFLSKLLRRPRELISSAFWPAALLYLHGGRPLVYAYTFTRRLRSLMVRSRTRTS